MIGIGSGVDGISVDFGEPVDRTTLGRFRQVADQVLFIEGGVVLESGPPAQVLGEPSQTRTRQFLQRILDPI